MVDQIENSYGAAMLFSLEDKEGYEGPNFRSAPAPWIEKEGNQVFYVTCHAVPFNPYLHTQILEDQLALIFPFIKYQFYLVEQDTDSHLFEFYGFDEKGPLWYGMLRHLRSAHGTVTLTYMSEIDEIPLVRKKGMVALRMAHNR